MGSCSSSVNLISEIDDADSVNEIRLAASMAPERPVSAGFAKMFRDRFGAGPVAAGSPENGRSGDSGAAGTMEADPAAFLKSQKERLKDL